MSYSIKNPHSLREPQSPGFNCTKIKVKASQQQKKKNGSDPPKKTLKSNTNKKDTNIVGSSKTAPQSSSRTISKGPKPTKFPIKKKLVARRSGTTNSINISTSKSVYPLRGLKRKRESSPPLACAKLFRPLPGKWSSSTDLKLVGIPVVEISSNCRRKAEVVAMKLRKALPKKSDKDDMLTDSEEGEEEDESDGGRESSMDEGHTTSSDADTETDDEETFRHSKPRTYPLRRKSVKSSIVPRRRTETPTRAGGSASDSSSESLLDIPPTCGSSHKWNYTSSNSVVKSPKRTEEKSTPSNKSRALRSKSTDVFTYTLDALQFARQAAAAAAAASPPIAHKYVKVTPAGSTSAAGKSPRKSKSPECDRLLRFDRQKSHPSTSTKESSPSPTLSDKPPELEKSYSFRHLESKITTPHPIHKPKKKNVEALPLSTAVSSSVSSSSTSKTTTASDDNVIPNVSAVADLPPPRKKPGRPRKDKSSISIIPPELDVPPAKRTRRTTSNELMKNSPITQPAVPSKIQKPSFSSTIEESSSLKRFPVPFVPVVRRGPGRPRIYHDPAKQQRDAIAQRARQSKIMAKSRVLQSNKYSFNASWRKPVARHGTTSDTTLCDPEGDQSSSSIDESGSASGENSSSPDGDQQNESEAVSRGSFQPNPGFAVAKSSNKPRNDPVAQCELCNLTFTRKFSLTKHLATRQHQRMLRKHGIKNETRKLRRGGPEEKKRPKEVDRLPLNSDDLNLPMDENHENSDALQGIEEEEEEQEEVKVQEWLSGRAIGVNNYVCDVCGDIFIKKFDFAAHLWSHRAGSDLVCPDCGLKFTESDQFNEHIDSAHTPDVKFSCKICPSKFNREDYLTKHVQSHKQDADQKFICSVCDKRFSTYDFLARHFDIKHLQLGKPKVEPFTEDRYSFANHLLFVRRSLTAAGEVDHDSENHDPNGESDDEEIEYEDAEVEYEDEEEEDDDDDPPQPIAPKRLDRQSRAIESSSLSPSRRVQGLNVRTYLKRTWLHDNSIIGCGLISDERIPPFSYSPLCCKDCGKTFETRKLLVKHVDYVNHSERYMCTVCKKTFKWRYLLNRHMTRHSRGKSQLRKKQEKLSKMKPRFLKNRQPTPSPPAVKTLPPPPKLLPILFQPKITVQLIPPLPDPVYQGKKETSLNTKMAGATSSSIKGTIPSAVRIPPSKITSAIKPKQSVLVTSATKTSSNSSKSITLKKNSGPSIKGSVVDQEVASTSTSSAAGSSCSTARKTTFEPKAGVGNKFFSCGLCSKSFTDKSTLTEHTRFHHNESLYNCPNCEAKCERKSDFDLHFKCHETNQPFFLCYVCFKPFRWKKDMIRHVRKKHPDERTYRCLYCNERFRVNDELNDHISESHAKHRNYPCEYCGKRYAQKRYLLLHIRTQHGIGEESGMEADINPDQYLLVEDMVEEEEGGGGGDGM